MKAADARTTRIRLAMLVAALTLATTVRAAEHPDIPEPPEPPSPPEVSVKGFTIRPGETHKGNMVRFAPSVAIEGTLDGDLYTTASTVRISGVVTGDVFAAGSSVDLTGKVEKSFRAAAGNVLVDGTVEGNVLVTGGNLVLGSKAHVEGSVTAYTGQFTHHGVVDGSLTFTGGTASLGGKVLDDATLTADAISIEPGARVEGDITYSTRKRMDDELRAITGGDVSYDEAHVLDKKEKKEEEKKLRPTTFGVGKWIAFFSASFLFGCALLAVFKEHELKVSQAIGTDALRCTGIGFVSILVTIAVCLSVILLVTIPFIVIYLLAYVVAAYLAKIPVAIWLGRFLLGKVNRPSGPYLSLFVGLVALYLVFMLPFCFFGFLAQIFTALLGLGAMTMTYLAHRQARKEAAVGGTPVSS
jgi:cytoskeletal protein CcmA (bactofilin family)